MSERTTIDDLVTAARTRLQRLTPPETFAAVRDGEVLIDIRSQDQRREQGVVPQFDEVRRAYDNGTVVDP